jgi:ParB family chromosome partitioning protein
MSDKRQEKRGLGRGLSALMADMQVSSDTATALNDQDANADAPDQIRVLPIEDIHPNPNQPRRNFDESLLQELASSISTRGVLQPLIVRPRKERDGFELVAGERRWRAAQLARVHKLPVIIRDYDDQTLLQVAIIENIQRADLSPVEEAKAYRELMDHFGHTQEKVAEALGKSRSHIANSLRLLSLPDDVLELLEKGAISSGHARALVTLDNPGELARQIAAKGLNVRDVEEMARRLKSGELKGASSARSKGSRREKDPDTQALERDLALNLGMGVSIFHEPGGERGTLKVHYNTLDELDRVCRALSSVPKDMDF